METWTLRKTRAQNITTWGTRSFTVPLAPSCVDTKPTQYTYQYGSDTARQEWTGGEGSCPPPTGPLEPGKSTLGADIIFQATASPMQTFLTTPCNPQKYKRT